MNTTPNEEDDVVASSSLDVAEKKSPSLSSPKRKKMKMKTKDKDKEKSKEGVDVGEVEVEVVEKTSTLCGLTYA